MSDTKRAFAARATQETQAPQAAASPTSASRHADSDRGALLVEFALIVPVLVMLLLGIVTLGMSYNRSISLNNSARESARFAATLPVADNVHTWLNSVADVAKDAAAGDLEAAAPGQVLCVAYVYPDGTEPNDRTMSIVEEAGARQLRAGQPCYADGRPSGERRVQVTMQRESDVQAGIYSSTMTLDARSTARFERA